MKEPDPSLTNLKDDEINLKEIFNIIFQGKKLIAFFTVFAFCLSLIYSLTLQNIYKSTAILNPIEKTDSISGALENFSGIASLAGINLPASTQESNTAKAIEKLKSLSFFENEIMPNIKLEELMAVKYWDEQKNILVFDSNIYNVESNLWVRDFSFPQKQIPSAQESFLQFHDKNLFVNLDNQTGFVTLEIEHQSPFIAKQWADLIVKQINSFYREKDKAEAEKAINFLNSQLEKTRLSEVRLALVNILELEIQKLTLVEANELYVFDYIDPAAVMEEKFGPNRVLIIILGMLFSLIASIIFVLFRHFQKKDISSETNLNY
tara:strand:- start:5283 stop:6245 length:963 start_codon:yes stop_codon:yes gene_type:complete